MSDRDHRPGLLERWLLALAPLLLRLHALSLRYRVEGLEAAGRYPWRRPDRRS